MAHLNNLTNEYQKALGLDLFDEMPKSVIAAIAVSAMTMGGEYLEEARDRVAKEWETLFLNGIVAQRPGKVAKSIIAAPNPSRQESAGREG